MTKYLLILLTISSFFGCSDKRENTVLEFLNKNEKKFDKKSYELIELVILDTLYEDDKQELIKAIDLTNVNDSVLERNMIDHFVIDEEELRSSYIWEYGSYTQQLYDQITSSDFDDEYHIPNKFFTKVKLMPYTQFKKLSLNDTSFKSSLTSNVSLYNDFRGCYSQDSLLNYLNKELDESKKLLAYKYSLKFRVNNMLREKILYFDKNDKQIAHYISIQ